jgi:hypothetical protein
MTVGPQRHPSRDRPTTHEHEYELPYGGNKGVNFVPGGYYDDEDLKHSKGYWQAEGADTDPKVKAEAGGVMNYAQGRLFDPEKHEAANRQKLGRERFEAMDSGAEQIRNQALQSSTIPTSHLQDRPGRMWTDVTTRNEGRGWEGSGTAGWYRGPAGTLNPREPGSPDVIAIDPNSSHGTDTTFIHEAGHRRHLGDRPAWSDYVTHPKGAHPDPLKEGVADAYVDRYGGPTNRQVRPMREDIEAGGGQKFTSYQFTGYSSDKEAARRHGWNDDDRAVYAATRGHASETGEQPLYVPRGGDVREQKGIADYGGGDATIDATLHHLLSTSPHAAQALRQTGLKDVGARAFRRHRDRELLSSGQSVQGALFHELRGVASRKVHGYTPNIDAMPEAKTDEEFEAKFEGMHKDIDRLEGPAGEMLWPEHMSHNQFGEKPRTQADLANSLGVSRVHSSKLGFPER